MLRIESFCFLRSDLPKNNDGIVRNIYFFNCFFHPNCEGVVFENCMFEKCAGNEYLSKIEKMGESAIDPPVFPRRNPSLPSIGDEQ